MRSTLMTIALFGLVACEGPAGPQGPTGADGADGADGAAGPAGPAGPAGMDAPVVVPDANIPSYVKRLVEEYGAGTIDPNIQFPLADTYTDTLRAIEGMGSNTVISWLDPITRDPAGPVWGSNNDYLAYVDDGFNFGTTNGPQAAGTGTSGWLWSNFEYISNSEPALFSAPSGQNLTLAIWMQQNDRLDFDVTDDLEWTQERLNTFVETSREMHGGGWIRVVQDPASGEWHVDLAANNVRYDGTSNTQAFIDTLTFPAPFVADDGTALPTNVAPGITGDCSGGLSPWGTIITAEENVQGYFGDLEDGYSSQFLDPNDTHGFVPGGPVVFDRTPSLGGDWGQHGDPNFRKAKDAYGYLVEIDAGQAPDEYYEKNTDGVGHLKMGSFGRARWENATFVTDTDWNMTEGQPIVMYAGQDRRSGRVYKWVSDGNVPANATRAQLRDLMTSGRLYVAHFADLDNNSGFTVNGMDPIDTADRRGTGQWIELSVDSTDTAPNAGATGLVNPAGVTTVGEALQDNNYNNIGGFPTDNDVLRALFTASNKIGVMETNRPEDVEWNPFDQLVYIAFTGHGDDTTLNDDGVLNTVQSDRRMTHPGTLMTVREADQANPAASTSFEFFVFGEDDASLKRVATGTQDDANGVFSWAALDNIMIDGDGGVWFGTDGNPRQNTGTDGLYFFDNDPAHGAGQPGIVNPTYGLAFRVASVPADSEATGPYIVPGGKTIFVNVQHPGEFSFSGFEATAEGRPLSSTVALFMNQ